VQTVAHSYFCVTNNLRLWQSTTFTGSRRFICAGVECNFPGPVGYFFPNCEVSSCDHNRFPIFIPGSPFILPPGETHIVRRSHLCSLRDPGELVAFGVPLSLRSDGGAAKNGGFAVVERDGVVGEPGAKGFTALGGDGFRETALEFQQEQGARGERRLGERIGRGAGKLGERVQPRRNGSAERIVLSRQRKDRDGTEEKADHGWAMHAEYAISRKDG
jgi:hypothetical protein